MHGAEPHPPLADQLGFRIVRLSQAVRAAHARHLTNLGVGVTEAWALKTIHGKGAGRPGDLAKALGVDPAGVTRMIKKMAGKGLIRRSRHGDDLRSVHLELTPKALDLLVMIDEAVAKAERDLRKGMTPQDAAQLQTLLADRLRSAEASADD